jgi:osmoprotectant transport system substrate-binding protein
VRRNLFAFLSLLVAVFAISACGSSKKSSSSSTSSSTPSTSTPSSSGSSSLPGKGKPAITLGDKNFPEQYILGYLYKLALEKKGYTVNLKPNLGSSEITDKALTSGKIDAYPEYTGVIVNELKGDTKRSQSAAAAYTEAHAWEASRGFALSTPTPFQDKDVLVVQKAFAAKHGLKSVADLKKLKSFTLGGPPENRTRFEGVVGLHKAYGLTNLVFKPLTIGIQYQALDQGKVDVATVFTTDGQLTKPRYQLLSDPKGIFGYQQVALVVKQSLLAKEGAAFKQTVDAVSAKLDNKAMQTMNAAVVLNKLNPQDVAKKFLQANGLL